MCENCASSPSGKIFSEKDNSEVSKLIEKYRSKKGFLIPLLQDIQSVFGYVPQEACGMVARELDIYPSEIYGILTFYSQFYMEPRGKHIIRVCQGTACHVMGGREILEFLSDELGIEDGESTDDGMFFLERVACLGCCGMAPVVMIDEDFHGRCSIGNLRKLVEEYRSKD